MNRALELVRRLGSDRVEAEQPAVGGQERELAEQLLRRQLPVAARTEDGGQDS